MECWSTFFSAQQHGDVLKDWREKGLNGYTPHLAVNKATTVISWATGQALLPNTPNTPPHQPVWKRREGKEKEQQKQRGTHTHTHTHTHTRTHTRTRTHTHTHIHTHTHHTCYHTGCWRSERSLCCFHPRHLCGSGLSHASLGAWKVNENSEVEKWVFCWSKRTSIVLHTC